MSREVVVNFSDWDVPGDGHVIARYSRDEMTIQVLLVSKGEEVALRLTEAAAGALLAAVTALRTPCTVVTRERPLPGVRGPHPRRLFPAS